MTLLCPLANKNVGYYFISKGTRKIILEVIHVIQFQVTGSSLGPLKAALRLYAGFPVPTGE
jgi:hypothetical protein